MLLKGYRLPIGERTCIMGILNVTPDSFSDGGEYFDTERAVDRAVSMAEEGADIIDIGGESSRPGSSGTDPGEEIRRVIPVLRAVRVKVKVPISIDTSKSEVAREALKEGASIINDITALNGDRDMAGIVAANNAGVVLMHMKGKPADMQIDPRYGDVVEEIKSFFKEVIASAERAGIDGGRIIVDPGIGFGKTLEHNLEILKRLREFRPLGKSVLVGVSRKAFIGALTGKAPGERLLGTAASVTAAILNGADIVRVHDVAQMKEAAKVADAVNAGGHPWNS